MANITITVQSLLNTAVYNSYTIADTSTVNQLKTAIQTATSVDPAWFDVVLNESILSGTSTLASLGIITGTVLRTHNKISRLTTREDRQKAKLDLAALDRAASSRPSTYDITELPTQYSGDTVVDNANSGGLLLGRPWA
jgi:hypothetical protein